MRALTWVFILLAIIPSTPVLTQEVAIAPPNFLELQIWKSLSYLSLDEEESQALWDKIVTGAEDQRFLVNKNRILLLGFPDGREHWVKFS